MAKTVYERTKRDAKTLARETKVGDVLYTVVDTATNLAPYEDAQLYSRFEVTHTHPLLGGPMIGSMSVEALVLRDGPVYTAPPKGMRGLHEAPRQAAGPLPKGKEMGRDLREYPDLELKNDAAAELRSKSRTGRGRRWM